MREGEMRLLYCSSSAPALTLTFVSNEINEAAKHGDSVLLASHHRPPVRDVAPEYVDLLASGVFFDSLRSVDLIRAIASSAVRTPARFSAALKFALSSSPVRDFRDRASLMYHLAQACWLANLLRSRPPDAIHSHGIAGPTSTAAFVGILLGRPYICTLHGQEIFVTCNGIHTKLERAGAVRLVSESGRVSLCERFADIDPGKLRVIHCGIDVDAFAPASGSPGTHEPLRMLSVGRLEEYKGHDVLLQACSAIRDHAPDFTLTIVGYGTQEAFLRAMSGGLGLAGTVTFAGPLPNDQVRELLQSADLFVLACKVAESGARDGLPLAIPEALASGLPVVSTRLVGIPEAVYDGENGLLADPADVESLSSCLERVLCEPGLYQHLRANARRSAVSGFSIRHVYESLSRLFREVVESGGS